MAGGEILEGGGPSKPKRYTYHTRQRIGFIGLIWFAWLMGYGCGAAAYA